MAAYATVADYEARAAVTLTGARLAQVQAYLDDASALISRHTPAGHTPDADMLKALTITIVRRVIANPGGYRQRTIGQYSETLGENGGLYLTADEVDMLQPEPVEDPDADAAYSVVLRDEGLPGWAPDPYATEGRWL